MSYQKVCDMIKPSIAIDVKDKDMSRRFRVCNGTDMTRRRTRKIDHKVNSTSHHDRHRPTIHENIVRIVVWGCTTIYLSSQYLMAVSAFVPLASTPSIPFLSTTSISTIQVPPSTLLLHLDTESLEYDATSTATTTVTDTNYDGDSALTTESFRERYNDALPLWLLNKCEECGYVYPTRIQEQVLDAVLLPSNNNSNNDDPTNSNNNNFIVQSETGSGKTLAFLLPCLANIDATRSTVQVLIVVPTRELGLQIARVAKRLASSSASTIQNSSDNIHNSNDDNQTQSPKKIMIMSVLQGSQNRRQRAWAWAEPPHMIIGTPEELCTMIRSGGIKRYNSIKYLIVDEVDACLLNNIGKLASSSAGSTRGQSTQFTGTPLHELLSKYLSPTYDDGREALAMESDSASVTVGSSNNYNGNHNANGIQRPILQSRTTIFCSATIPQHRYFAKQCVQNQWMLHAPTYVSLRTGSQHLPSQLTHSYMITSEPGKKLATLRRIIKKLMTTCRQTNIPNRVVVFSDHNRPFEEIAKVLAKDLNGFYYNERTVSSLLSSTSTTTSLPPLQYQALVSVLRYEDSLSQRAIAMDALRGDSSNYRHKRRRRTDDNTAAEEEADDDSNDDEDDDIIDDDGNENALLSPSQAPTTLLRVLLSTDLAARGLDIVDITHIIHMDLPDNADIYVHRSGRTGRLNRPGHVISIITQEQEFVLQRIINQLQVDITCIGRPTTTSTA